MCEGVSGYLMCLLWLNSNSTIWGMCVVFYSSMFGHIYMKGGGGHISEGGLPRMGRLYTTLPPLALRVPLCPLISGCVFWCFFPML